MNAEEYVVNRLVKAEQESEGLRASIGAYEEQVMLKTKQLEALKAKLDAVAGIIERRVTAGKYGYSLCIYEDWEVELLADAVGVALPVYTPEGES